MKPFSIHRSLTGCRADPCRLPVPIERSKTSRRWSHLLASAALGLSVTFAWGDYQLTNLGIGTPPHAVAGGTYSLQAKVGAPSAVAQSGGDFTMTGSGPIAVSDQVAVVPGAATLFIAREGSSLTLSWLDTGVVLETATGVDAATVWQVVSPAPAGQTYAVPVKDPVRFYRLRRL